MPDTYEVGERVRVKQVHADGSWTPGHVGTVTRIEPDGCLVVEVPHLKASFTVLPEHLVPKYEDALSVHDEREIADRLYRALNVIPSLTSVPTGVLAGVIMTRTIRATAGGMDPVAAAHDAIDRVYAEASITESPMSYRREDHRDTGT